MVLGRLWKLVMERYQGFLITRITKPISELYISALRSNDMAYINLGGKICGEIPDEMARSIIAEIRASEKPDYEKMRRVSDELKVRILEQEASRKQDNNETKGN